MRDIKELDLIGLKELFRQWQEEPFHAGQVFTWIYKKDAHDFEQMSNLAVGLRELLKENFYIYGLKTVKKLESSDLTLKLLLGLSDGNSIEAVLIPTSDRVTGCVSSQVGCRFGCRFCASGLLGFKRNLSAGEMIEELLLLKQSSQGPLTHIVFMGTGEPLDNYDNVLKTVRIINSKESLNIGARRITISTCGLIPAIARLASEGLQVELSVSLHAANDALRDRIMPINKKYPLRDLIAAIREYIRRTDRQVTFEYVLIRGQNAGPKDAADLSMLLRGLNCKINLIPANPVAECAIEPPNKLEALFFADALKKKGLNVTLRKSRGQDIQAACGQLRLKYEKK